jgi:aspartate aminotransferase-like enzyme
MAAAMINHRGEEFGQTLLEVLGGLQQIFRTASPILLFTASGSGGLEAAVTNVLSPGDRVLALSCGHFGERFAAIAATFGAAVVKEEVEWGRGIDPQQVREALHRHGGIKAVLVTHNETSTGVANDLRAIAEVVRPSGALLLVDAVSSLGAIDLWTDAWGLDVVVTASQKALMGPPGATFLSVSPRAWEAAKLSRMPKHYFSFAQARDAVTATHAYSPFTPAVPVIFALHVSIAMILDAGVDAHLAHHRRLAQTTREGITALGLSLFAQPSRASDAVTAIRLPRGVDGKELLRRLRTQHGVVLAGGQGRLEKEIFRIGHMGYVQEEQIVAALGALKRVLAELGYTAGNGGAVEAAAQDLGRG